MESRDNYILRRLKEDREQVEVVEKEFKEKLFFGNRQILEKGNVTSRIVGGMDELSQYDGDVLKKKILRRLSKNKRCYSCGFSRQS